MKGVEVVHCESNRVLKSTSTRYKRATGIKSVAEHAPHEMMKGLYDFKEKKKKEMIVVLHRGNEGNDHFAISTQCGALDYVSSNSRRGRDTH